MRILLTGASRGLGAFLAPALAKGNHLVLVARDADRLARVAETVRAAGGDATVVAADVTSPDDRARLVATAGDVDVLIHNAGIEIAVALADQSPDDIGRQLDLNLAAPIQLTRALLPGMIARGRGAVVFISSMSGKTPTPWNSVYAATKHALVGFASSLRIELRGTGVHSSVVCPTFVAETGMWSETGVKAPALSREVTPAAFVRAVRRAIDGAPEVLVVSAPVRPLLALAQLFPGLDAVVLGWLGVLDALRARAAAVKR